MDYRNDFGNHVGSDSVCLAEGALVALNDADIACVAGGQSSAWYQVGHSVADAYQWARLKTTDFFEWALG